MFAYFVAARPARPYFIGSLGPQADWIVPFVSTVRRLAEEEALAVFDTMDCDLVVVGTVDKHGGVRSYLTIHRDPFITLSNIEPDQDRYSRLCESALTMLEKYQCPGNQ